MKKWITGTLIACTIVSSATVSFAKSNYSYWQSYIQKWLSQNWQVTEQQKPVTKPEANPETNAPVDNQSEYAKQVLNLVNQERAKYGLSALTLDNSLTAVAQAHSQDMANNKYFSHTNLKGQSPFDRMKAYGISYKTAAENIAAGQKSPQQVVNSWMNSEGHRKNILNGSFNKMGLGYVKTQGGYGTYWTQVFTN